MPLLGVCIEPPCLVYRLMPNNRYRKPCMCMPFWVIRRLANMWSRRCRRPFFVCHILLAFSHSSPPTVTFLSYPTTSYRIPYRHRYVPFPRPCTNVPLYQSVVADVIRSAGLTRQYLINIFSVYNETPSRTIRLSLQHHLDNPALRQRLVWRLRVRTTLHMCSGLEYLHSESTNKPKVRDSTPIVFVSVSVFRV